VRQNKILKDENAWISGRDRTHLQWTPELFNKMGWVRLFHLLPKQHRDGLSY